MLIRMGAGCQGNQLLGERAGTYPHSLTSGEGRGLGDLNDFINHVCVMEPPRKTPRWHSGSYQVGECMKKWGEWF